MSARQQEVMSIDRSRVNSRRRIMDRAALTACTGVEWLESRRLLAGTPVPISTIPDIYNSVEAPMTISSSTVHFTLTNTGNVTSSVPTAFEFSYFPSDNNGYAGYLDYKSERVILGPNKSRRMAIGLTAAQVQELKTGLPVHLDVVVSEYESASVLVNL